MEDQIVSILQHSLNPMSARQLTSQLKQERTAVNRTLYGLLKQNRVRRFDETPPTWSNVLCEENAKCDEKNGYEQKQATVITVVFVDLGCCHDCLENLVPYATSDNNLQVYAFADVAFNGYGVNPVPPPPISVCQAQTRDSNAADIELIWKAAELIFKAPRGTTFKFIVATKDQGFTSLQTIVQRHGHSLEFVKDWNELRQYVE